MASDQQFCLRWNNHQSTLISVFDTLLENEKLVDCTLAADGQYLKAHKVVLSACSPYLEAMLSQHFDQHPILILKDVKYQELKAMLDYMYRGEVNISEEQLGHFLKAAESLQIKGLSDRGGGGSGGGGSESGNDQAKRHEARKPATHVPHLTSPRTVVPHPVYGSEQKKPHMNPQDLVRSKSPMARDESGSPSRKRRRPARPSSTDSNIFSAATHYSESFSEGNSSDTPSSNVPTVNTTPTATTTKAPSETERNEPDNYLGQPGAAKPVIKTEIPHTLVQPKTEYVDYENEDSVEDATLDGDDDDEANLSRPGPSFTSGSPGMTPWQLSADGSNDEMFLAAQEGAGANQNSQDLALLSEYDDELLPKNEEVFVDEIRFSDEDQPNNSVDDPIYVETDNKIDSDTLNTLPTVCAYIDRIEKSLTASELSECHKIKYGSVKEGRKQRSITYKQRAVRYMQRNITSEKNFKCSKCCRKYKYKKGLLQHMRLMCYNPPQFSCEFCDTEFTYKNVLKRHIFSEHEPHFKTWFDRNYFSSHAKLPTGLRTPKETRTPKKPKERTIRFRKNPLEDRMEAISPAENGTENKIKRRGKPKKACC